MVDANFRASDAAGIVWLFLRVVANGIGVPVMFLSIRASAISGYTGTVGTRTTDPA